MPEIDLFHRYYDLLFVQKDYRKETDIIFSIAGKLQKQPIETILEVGCGTGNHSFEMARFDASITAVDTDAIMIELAERKKIERAVNNVAFIRGNVSTVSPRSFDVAVAMFNVVSYIREMKELLDFMMVIELSLKPGGVFIFDCWNGIAAIKDPPGSKTTTAYDGDNFVSCLLTNETDFFNQKTKLNYAIEVRDREENILNKEAFSFSQTLWTPNQIKYALARAGLEVKTCCRNFEPETPATDKDWKIMFACVKVNQMQDA